MIFGLIYDRGTGFDPVESERRPIRLLHPLPLGMFYVEVAMY